MFIENRIEKRNETDSCKVDLYIKVDFEKNLLEIIFKRFFRKSKKGTISSAVRKKSYSGQTTVNYKTKHKRLFNLQPKQLFAKLKQ